VYCYPEKENIFLKSSVKDVSLFSKDVIPSSKDVTLPSKDVKLNGSRAVQMLLSRYYLSRYLDKRKKVC